MGRIGGGAGFGRFSTEEFPDRNVIEELIKKGMFKKTDKVRILDNFRVWKILKKGLRRKETLCHLGHLHFSSDASSSIFKEFLNKFARKGWREQTWQWQWEIEYEILVCVYQALRKNPRELEEIINLVKTKEDLKIHLGVS